ncbi:MAG: 2-oxo acid dehydrogenase subunit E2, partial [candidate division Zixibacteria bacterium]|nr:2-oxo acid dehydrogenase subunit E2 [candidate division Zixibacteria bacterium]
TILEWKVKIGDHVSLNQPLVELMTDKVNVEIPAEAEGVITQILAEPGQVVPVGFRIAIIDGTGASVATAAAPTAPTASKAAAHAPAPAVAIASASSAVKGTAAIGKGQMSPKVKMLVREYAVDPSTITPTGKNGLVTVDDVMRAVESRSSAAGFTAGPIPSASAPVTFQAQSYAPSAPAAAHAAPKTKIQIPVFAPLPADQRETRTPLAGVRKLIADHMVKSKATSPHVTTFEDIDMTELVAFRNSIKDDFKSTYGVNITYMPFIIKAACLAMKDFPYMNASLTDKEIIVKNYFNIGVAVAREDGLIVPVIKDADKKTIVEMAAEIAMLGEKARTNKLTPDDISGGTFSVTNAGMFGAMASTPIINQPQVAILGVHAIVKKPWVVNNQIVIRDISTFAVSFDHRLIDGHVAVQMLHRVHEYLADPRKFALSLR